jgi:hypothetical protein
VRCQALNSYYLIEVPRSGSRSLYKANHRNLIGIKGVEDNDEEQRRLLKPDLRLLHLKRNNYNQFLKYILKRSWIPKNSKRAVHNDGY